MNAARKSSFLCQSFPLTNQIGSDTR
jgi:hypothetical protein